MITGIIMASGFSKRMNRDKLTLSIDGEPVIEKVIRAAKESSLDEIILVFQKKEVNEIGMKYDIKTIFNPCPEKGQSQSMKIGIKSSDQNTKAFMFIVGDQPLLDSETINTIIDTFNKNNCDIVVPVYNEKPGSPTVFSSSLKDELLQVEGDKGGRKIIEKMIDRVRYVCIEDHKVGLDMDTWDEYEELNRMGMKK